MLFLKGWKELFERWKYFESFFRTQKRRKHYFLRMMSMIYGMFFLPVFKCGDKFINFNARKLLRL